VNHYRLTRGSERETIVLTGRSPKDALEAVARDRTGHGKGLHLTGAEHFTTEGVLAGARLAGIDFTGAHLSELCFAGADFTGAGLDYADLTLADLSDVDLDGASLFMTQLYAADLSGVRLQMANLKAIREAFDAFIASRIRQQGLAPLLMLIEHLRRGRQSHNGLPVGPLDFTRHHRAARRWLASILPSATAEDCPIAAITLSWATTFLASAEAGQYPIGKP
jgi:hypothetical protein